jgi:hypothetical protein
MSQIIGIFGSQGYLGKETLNLCHTTGTPTRVLGRRIESIDNNFLDGLTLIIDCGFPRDYYNRKTACDYLAEVEKRAQFCNEFGIKYYYLTTYTSVVSDRSKYSQLKSLVETSVKSMGGELLRLGLVIDASNPGGRFLELKSIIQRLPVVFVPSFNWFPVFTCSLDAYLEEVKNLLENGEMSKHELGNLQPLAEVITQVSEGKKLLQLSDLLTCIVVRFLPLVAFGKREGIKGISVKINEIQGLRDV